MQNGILFLIASCIIILVVLGGLFAYNRVDATNNTPSPSPHISPSPHTSPSPTRSHSPSPSPSPTRSPSPSPSPTHSPFPSPSPTRSPSPVQSQSYLNNLINFNTSVPNGQQVYMAIDGFSVIYDDNGNIGISRDTYIQPSIFRMYNENYFNLTPYVYPPQSMVYSFLLTSNVVNAGLIGCVYNNTINIATMDTQNNATQFLYLPSFGKVKIFVPNTTHYYTITPTSGDDVINLAIGSSTDSFGAVTFYYVTPPAPLLTPSPSWQAKPLNFSTSTPNGQLVFMTVDGYPAVPIVDATSTYIAIEEIKNQAPQRMVMSHKVLFDTGVNGMYNRYAFSLTTVGGYGSDYFGCVYNMLPIAATMSTQNNTSQFIYIPSTGEVCIYMANTQNYCMISHATPGTQLILTKGNNFTYGVVAFYVADMVLL